MESYIEKMEGHIIDTVFCNQCKTFKIIMIGIKYDKCPSCNKKYDATVEIDIRTVVLWNLDQQKKIEKLINSYWKKS